MFMAGGIAGLRTAAARGRPRRPRPGRARGAIRQLAVVTMALAAVLAINPAPASAATVSWIAAAWSIRDVYQVSPATANHFFNRPSSYLTGPQTKGLALDGLKASPALWFGSYAAFASDLRTGAIKYPYHWLYYDPEDWSFTPLDEQQNPRRYMRMFAKLAHEHGYKVIEAPARDLGNVTGSICPKQTGETLDQWYINCDVAGWAAHYSDIYEVQDQANTTNVSEYDWLFSNAEPQAVAANPDIVVDCGLSTNKGTPAQMAAAAESVTPDGFYVTIVSGASASIHAATQFFQDMKAAGY
jgi:hypothetical protein